MQCAELRGHFDPAALARRVAELAGRYNGALVAVERNNHGHAVIAQMLTVHGYANLFPAADGEKPGWLTTRVNRPQMLELLAALLARSPELFHSRRLLEECRTFVRHENGRAEAERGAHDDAVMAMAIALAREGSFKWQSSFAKAMLAEPRPLLRTRACSMRRIASGDACDRFSQELTNWKLRLPGVP